MFMGEPVKPMLWWTPTHQFHTSSCTGPLTVDETVTEPSAQLVWTYLSGLGRLRYPVAFDTTGRVADGYSAQDQPWFVLTSPSGKILWSHAGWLPLSALEAAARHG
jgi:hypothetical protein